MITKEIDGANRIARFGNWNEASEGLKNFINK